MPPDSITTQLTVTGQIHCHIDRRRRHRSRDLGVGQGYLLCCQRTFEKAKEPHPEDGRAHIPQVPIKWEPVDVTPRLKDGKTVIPDESIASVRKNYVALKGPLAVCFPSSPSISV